MSESSPEHSALRVLSGEDRSLRASLLRGALRMAEPVYAGAMSARNSADCLAIGCSALLV